MIENKQQSFPRWIFAFIAIGGLLASGIYLGIMSIEGFAGMHLAKAIGYGIMSLVMFWGATHRN
jgi:hypothetical protein